jgi:hypothetical protein
MSSLYFEKASKSKFQAPIGRIDQVKADYQIPRKKQKDNEEYDDFKTDIVPWEYKQVKNLMRGNVEQKNIKFEKEFDLNGDGKPKPKGKKIDKISKLKNPFKMKNGEVHFY